MRRSALVMVLLVGAVAGVVGVGMRRGWFREVGAPGSPERLLDERCGDLATDARQDCYLKGLEARLADSGVAAAMRTLQAIAKDDPRMQKEGHVYAHGVGIKAFQLTHDVPGAFNQCPTDFASGCGHGVLQAYLESQDSLSDETINGLCQPYRSVSASKWRLSQCIHGTGHGLVMMLQGDLPRALANCDRLKDGWEQDGCYGGAFMENIMRVTNPHHPASELAASHHHHEAQAFKSLDSTNLLYPCTAVTERYHRACYEIQTAAILHYTKGDIAEASAVCDKAPEAMRPVCYSSLGRDISSKALRKPAKALKYCREAGETYRPWCYVGVTKALVDWDAKPDPGFAFCKMVGDGPGARLCNEAVGQQVLWLGSTAAERIQLCAVGGEPEAVKECQWAAGIPGAAKPTRAL